MVLAENEEAKNLQSTNVLIIGAGPVGILTANLLGQQGISTLVIDQNPGILEIPRAISLDQDALRVLQIAGLSEKAATCMPSISEVEMISPYGGILMRIKSAGSIDGHPRLVSIYQPDLERILREGLDRFENVRLWPECTYFNHTETETGIQTVVRCKDKEYKISTGFLLGCDGANSSVRNRQGWKLKGSSYKEDWLILDVADLPEVLDKVEFFCDPRRPIAHVPGPGNSQRWEFLLRNRETKEELSDQNTLAKLMKPWGDPSKMHILRKAVYRFQAKTANCIGHGRVFLLGDAAHLTPPFAGQGLVSGMRDSANLAWKIAAVLRGQASHKILSSYDIERRPHAKKMIRLAVFMGSIIMTRSRIVAFFRDIILKFLQLTPLRPFFSEMKIKPQNRFPKGLFIKDAKLKKSALIPGSNFPQAPVLLSNGSLAWSDVLLGKGPTIIGFGVDPYSILSTALKEFWKSIGGSYVCIANLQQEIIINHSTLLAKDATSTFLSIFGGANRFAIVRPDRIVACTFTSASASPTIRKFAEIYTGATP